MTITTDRPTTAGMRSRSGVVERRRRSRPVPQNHTRRTQNGPCLPVVDESWIDVTDREMADRDFDDTSAHFANQTVRPRSLVLWMLAVVVVACGLIGIANLSASTPDAATQPAGAVMVHDGALVEYAPSR